jgi:hypothetical protein
MEVPTNQGRWLSEIHETCQVLEKKFENGIVRLRVRAPKRWVSHLRSIPHGSVTE